MNFQAPSMNSFQPFSILLGILLATMAKPAGAAESAAILPPLAPTPRTPVRRPSAQTVTDWQGRKFGMFIHFGLFSIPGGVWEGRRVTNGYSEQIMSHAPIASEAYARLAGQFNPQKWDPEGIVRLAEDAGMKYIVITSKHHDGFNLFHTRLTDYNVVDATPYGRDILLELSRACARHGMGFGVYYSSIDWHDPRATPFTDDNNNLIPPAHADFNVGQLRELLSHYGPLAEVWFDMGCPTPDQSRRFADTVHELQPECLVSGRVFNHQGDFTVMGDNRIPDFIIEEPWQTPGSIYHQTWGYRSWQERGDLQEKIREHLQKLIQVASRGGNYLLNIGPRGDGSVVEFEAAVLRGLGRWLKVNGEAIYGTQPQPFRRLDFGYATHRPGKLYLLVQRTPTDGWLRLPGLQTPLTHAALLADPQKAALPLKQSEDGWAVRMAAKVETEAAPPVTVVEADYAGDLEVIPPYQKPDAHGVIHLAAADSRKFYNYNGRGYYDRPTVYKHAWEVALAGPGRYQVLITFNPGEPKSRVELTLGEAKVLVDCDGARSGDANSRTATALAGPFELKGAAFSTLAISVPPPFTKGDKLSVNVVGVTVTRLQ